MSFALIGIATYSSGMTRVADPARSHPPAGRRFLLAGFAGLLLAACGRKSDKLEAPPDNPPPASAPSPGTPP